MSQIALLVPREQADSDLDNFIDKAEKLLAFQIAGEQDLDSALEQYRLWCDECAFRLNQIFSTNEFHNEFTRAAGGRVIFDNSLRSQVIRLHEDLSKHLLALRSIKNRMKYLSDN